MTKLIATTELTNGGTSKVIPSTISFQNGTSPKGFIIGVVSWTSSLSRGNCSPEPDLSDIDFKSLKTKFEGLHQLHAKSSLAYFASF